MIGNKTIGIKTNIIRDNIPTNNAFNFINNLDLVISILQKPDK